MKEKQKEPQLIIRKTFQVSGMPVELCEEIGLIARVTFKPNVASLLQEAISEYKKNHKIKLPERSK